MSNKNKTKEQAKLILAISSAVGVYAPQQFCMSFPYDQTENVDLEDWKICLEGPDNDLYWDAWIDISDSGLFMVKDKVCFLYQPEDVWLCPVEDADLLPEW